MFSEHIDQLSKV